jgi:hypothetical protein
MFSRRREQIIVLLGLVIVNAALGWYLYRQWKDYKSRTQWIYRGVTAEEASPPSTPKDRIVVAQTFAEIVDHNLFRPDRTNVSPTENAKMPELPYLFGTMNLGEGSFALMGPGDQPPGPAKRVVPGEEIGGYKLVSISGSQVVVQWGEKKVSIDASESARRVPRVIVKTEKRVAVAPTATSTINAPTPQVTTVASSGGSQSGKYGPAGFNAPPGAPADAPAGTVIDGKRKVVQNVFGVPKVYWEDVQKPDATSDKTTPK